VGAVTSEFETSVGRSLGHALSTVLGATGLSEVVCCNLSSYSSIRNIEE
jgi:hypothetical protein